MTPYEPLINTLKYFRIRFRICGDIRIQRWKFVNQRWRIQRWFRISAVGYRTNSESALSDTAPSLNQRCIWQRWLLQRRNYLVKTYLWKLISALSDTALIPNQRCIIQRWFWISIVGYIADSELALYDTALIHECSTDSIFKFKNDVENLKI